MKFSAALAGIAAFALVGCAAQRDLPPVPSERMAASSSVSLATLKRGHHVYLKHCGRCHAYEMPDEVSGPDWHIVVPGMAWNAGISQADEAAVLQYVIAARKR
jgi:cytochrome c5